MGSFNSPHIYRGLWGEPLEGFLPPKFPLRGGRALYRAPLEVALAVSIMNSTLVTIVYLACVCLLEGKAFALQRSETVTLV